MRCLFTKILIMLKFYLRMDRFLGNKYKNIDMVLNNV